MKLADHADPLAWDTAFWLMGFRAPDCPLEQTGPRAVELCAKLRALAIIALVTGADTDTFLHNLIRSAGVREHYLARWQAAGRDDDHDLAASRLDGWFDAVAGGAPELALRIAARSPDRWIDTREYEDDFAYAMLLFALLRDDRAGAQAWLARFEAALDGEPGPRAAVARALVARDPHAFGDAFEALLEARDDEIEAAIARGQMDDAIVVPPRLVFVEGLALLRLATMAGIATAPEYRMCPSLARQPMRTPYPGE